MSPDIIRPGDAAKRRQKDEPFDKIDDGETSWTEELSDDEEIGENEADDVTDESYVEDDVVDFTDEADINDDIQISSNNISGDAELNDKSVESNLLKEPTVEKKKKPSTGNQRSYSASLPVTDETDTGSKPMKEGFYKKLYHGRTRIDFVRRKRIWFAISLVVIFAGLISLSTRGLDLGIDFSGGTAWQVRTSTVTPADARSALTPLGYGGATITVLGSAASTKTLQVEAKLGNGATPNQAQVARVTAALARLAGVNSEAVGVDSVGPSWGGSVTNKAIEALIVFFIVVSLYISIFFEWRMALAAVLAVIHDVLVVVGIYSLTGLEVTPDTVVAILTILGYSLYDTIVVFDRVRDNVGHIGSTGRLSISDIVNLSMNQTLARSINTSLVAILPILSVLILGADILGAQTLQYFGWALLIGLLSGAYSSIFIASPIVAFLKEKEPKYKTIRERLQARGLDRQIYSASAVASGVLASDYFVRGARSRKESVTPKTLSEKKPGTYQKRIPGTDIAASHEDGNTFESTDDPTSRPRPTQAGVYRPKASAKSRRKGRQR